MLNERTVNHKGFSLIELMVGVAVGLFVVLAATAIYLNATTTGRDAAYANRLNQDMRAIMDVLVADVRRAGFWSLAAVGNETPNAFTVRTAGAGTDVFISTTPSCILYSYDLNATGTPAAGDFFGFRLNGNVVETAPATLVRTDDTAGACNANNAWVPLNDPNEVRVTALTFSAAGATGVAGSRCLVFNPDDYSEAKPETWVAWTSVEASEPACSNSGFATKVDVVGTLTNPWPLTTGRRAVEMRLITITLTAQHARDNSPTRTLTEKVLVRNNRVL
jgi:prepilin peptidase dependent protein B